MMNAECRMENSELCIMHSEFERSEIRDGGLAQLGERLPCKQEVSGSIPLISTTLTKTEGAKGNGPIAQLARAHD